DWGRESVAGGAGEDGVVNWLVALDLGALDGPILGSGFAPFERHHQAADVAVVGPIQLEYDGTDPAFDADQETGLGVEPKARRLAGPRDLDHIGPAASAACTSVYVTLRPSLK